MADAIPIRPPAGSDLDHSEQLEMAGSYIERSMGRVLMCIKSLESDGWNLETDDLRKAIIETLSADIHNDLDVAREIFQTWKAQEVAHGKQGR